MKAGTLLLLLVLASLAQGGGDVRPPAPPSGGARPKTRTWSGTGDDWIRDRYKVAVTMLEAKLPDQFDAEEIAKSVVAHWGIETNWGASEFDYNLGGIHATGSQPYFAALDAGQPTHFVAYDSVQGGAEGYGSLLMARYRACAMLLAENPEKPDWYVCLGSKGYYAKNPNAGSLITNARARVVQALAGGGSS